MNIQTLKGFRDFLPKDARKRNYVLNILKGVFESYGFEPLETPALEYEEILSGKYGDEGDKLMYKFEDNGGRKVAMRYDQTVPLARVVAQYANDLPLPFKRYQIQNVYRADNTQRGRYREFLQVDIDTVGSSSVLSDLEILQCVNSAMKALGFKDFSILINSRKVFDNLGPNSTQITRILDKEDKIGKDEVLKQLNKVLGSSEQTAKIYNMLKNLQPVQIPTRLREILDRGRKLKLNLFPMFFLARGLDYYTDTIFEVKVAYYKDGSVGGGGRYDELIGMFAGQPIPAVGFAFGFDRIIEAMNELNLFDGKDLGGTKVLITNNSDRSAEIANELRNKNINAELYVDDKELDKQLRYADKRKIPYVLVVSKDKLELKNMTTGEKKEVKIEEIVKIVA